MRKFFAVFLALTVLLALTNCQKPNVPGTVDFEVQNVYMGDYGEEEGSLWISSISELSEYYRGYSDSSKYASSILPSTDVTIKINLSLLNAIQKYDEEFFETKDLIVLKLTDGSGSIRYNVRELKLTQSFFSKKPYCVQPVIDRIIPKGGTEDLATWHIFIEVSKEYGAAKSKLKEPYVIDVEASNEGVAYKCNVVDNWNLLVEPLKSEYKEGETVTARLEFRSGPSTGIYLNGTYMGSEGVGEGTVTFTMPSNDVTIYTAQNGSIMHSIGDKFSFEITWDFDGCYNSETGVLKNGYNEDLNKACVTELNLTPAQLSEIYILLTSANFFELPNEIRENEVLIDPSYNLKITVNLESQSKTVVIYSPIKPVSEWTSYIEFGKVYFNIVDNYIRSSDEYKALPQNTNLYE